MEALKTVGLGVAFSFAGFVILSAISIMRGTASVEPAHATAVSAMVAGLIEALFNPVIWLVIVIGFVAATWVTRKTKR